MLQVDAGLTVGKYRVTEFVGRGGFALVYAAENRETGEKVALKFGDVRGGGRFIDRFAEVGNKREPGAISPDESPADAVFFDSRTARVDLVNDQEIDTLLLAEAETLRRLRSPNFVALKEVVRCGDRPVLVLEYVKGKTLREKVRALEGIRINWFLTIVRALERLNADGQLQFHGDLKPENILIKPTGAVVLLDPVPNSIITNTNAAVPPPLPATLNYNPLLLRNSKADVMGIGIILYEILTGTLPFDTVPWEFAGTPAAGETTRLSLSYFLSYVPPRELNSSAAPELEKIIYRCLAVADYGLDGLREDFVAFLRKP
ncbi:MAG: protein kinase domain-containing protein [Planctomycetota bacterium]